MSERDKLVERRRTNVAKLWQDKLVNMGFLMREQINAERLARANWLQFDESREFAECLHRAFIVCVRKKRGVP